MGNSKEDGSNTKDSNEIENARVGYQVAVNLWIYQAQQLWNRLNIMLVINGIIVGASSLLITSGSKMVTLQIMLPIGGIILCFAWLLLINRGFDYLTYYTLSARKIEEKYLSGEVETISRGGQLSNGLSINLKINGLVIKKRMNPLSRLARTNWISYTIIFVFIILYITLLLGK